MYRNRLWRDAKAGYRTDNEPDNISFNNKLCFRYCLLPSIFIISLNTLSDSVSKEGHQRPR